MSNRFDEMTQLEQAYRCLKTQPYEAQLRMLDWLRARCDGDNAKAKAERERIVRERIARKRPAESGTS